MTPDTPAAVRQWPMLLLTEPSAQYARCVGDTLRTPPSAPATSIGSPSFVPVPWASISWMLRRVDAEPVVHRLLQARLRIRVGRGDAVGLAVLVDAPALDHAVGCGRRRARRRPGA